MLRMSSFDVLIFDCDGVIFDSNELKLQAMEDSLRLARFPEEKIPLAISHFRDNFGLSRYRHVRYFVEELAKYPLEKSRLTEEMVLGHYATRCRSLYATATLSDGLIELLDEVDCELYVASGSDQEELRSVMVARGLSEYFSGVYGSPEPKSAIVEGIAARYERDKVLMIGDAKSDLDAATEAGTPFVFFAPFSTALETMLQSSKSIGFPVINSFKELM